MRVAFRDPVTAMFPNSARSEMNSGEARYRLSAKAGPTALKSDVVLPVTTGFERE